MANHDAPYKAEAGGPKVLWYIATASDPVTVDELSEAFDVERQTLYSSVIRLFRSGFVARRKREGGGGRGGGVPYEYALRHRDKEGT